LDDNGINTVERANYRHLVVDVAWFGLALAATSRFLSIYAIRLGAGPTELSWLAAVPGIALLISTGLSAWWRRHYMDSVRAIYWPAIAFRLVFLLPAFAPFFPEKWQPIWLILAVALPAIPQGVAGAIFIMLMREGVSGNQLTHLLSQRSLALNITVAIGAIGFGAMLAMLPFPANYQAMFVMAFAFSMVSHWHVMHVKTIFPEPAPEEKKAASVWRLQAFWAVALVAVCTHLSFFSIISLTPLRLVEELGADEGFMSMFALVELFAGALISTRSVILIRRLGLRNFIVLAMLGTAMAALVIANATRLEFTLAAAALSGASWTAATIGLFSYFVEQIPAEQSRKSAVAYQQMIALGVFIGPMVGGTMVDFGVSLVDVIKAGMLLRIAAALFIAFNVFDHFGILQSVRPRNRMQRA
jgi:predicted MFS family arabinose efflux permease